MQWTNAVAAWRTFMRAAGLPETTITLRVYHLSRLGAELRTSPWSTTTDQLLSWLAGQPWKPNTRRSYRASFRAFYRWAQESGHITLSPAALLPPVRVPRGLPRPAPEHGYRNAADHTDPRVSMAAQLAGACGMRRSEVAAARRDHIEPDLLGWSMRVTGKGGHVRLVPLPPELASLILARKPGWLFPSAHGGHLTPAWLGKIIARALPDGFATHSLRHRCGTQTLIACGGNLRVVQELLGHASPTTTAIYTQVQQGAIRAAVEAVA